MKNKIRILSIDGGGIRGIIPATILEYVENKLKEITKNKEARIADFFDLVAGTSTGGILTCFYLVPNPTFNSVDSENSKSVPTTKYTASKALEFYDKKGDRIFGQSKNNGWLGLRQLFNATKFSAKNIEEIFTEEFGDLKMTELVKHCIVTSYDMTSQSAVFFNSREIKPDREFKVKDVVRSTSAAPTYFPPAFIRNTSRSRQMVNLDGGVFANNPAMCAYVEARKSEFEQVKFPSAKDIIFLSLGTGGGRIKFPNITKSRKWGVVSWAKSAPEIMMDGIADTVNYQLKAIFGTLEGNSKKQYKRIDVPMEKRNYSTDMSNASRENIEALKAAGEVALTNALMDTDDELGLDEFIQLLVK